MEEIDKPCFLHDGITRKTRWTKIIMKLEMSKYQGAEVIHYYDATTGDTIYSKGNSFHFRTDGKEVKIKIKLPLVEGILGNFRHARRMLRLDKGNAVYLKENKSIILFYRGSIYNYDLETANLSKVAKIRVGRNVLHSGIACIDGRRLFYGEYFGNTQGEPVHIYRSDDYGMSWQDVYSFDAGAIYHIHGIYKDPYTDKLWIPTGDFDGQCYMAVADPDFNSVELLGDGSQKWRAVSPIFTKDAVWWGMDSPLADVFFMRFDRKTGELTQGQPLPGPVWYTKTLDDGVYLLQTSVEHGPGAKSDKAHLFVSTDLEKWTDLAGFKKDPLSHRYFKPGVIAFADGPQTSKDFVFHAEALEGVDGCSYTGRISDDREK